MAVKVFDVTCLSNVSLPNFTDPPAFAEPGVNFRGGSCLNEVRLGTANYNRIGCSIMMKSVDIAVEMYNATQSAFGALRAAVVYDTQPNGAFPANFQTVFAQQQIATFEMWSGINVNNSSRFVLLAEEDYVFEPPQLEYITLRMHVDLDLPAVYRATAGTIADIASGSLLFMVWMSRDAANYYFVNHVSRLLFTE